MKKKGYIAAVLAAVLLAGSIAGCSAEDEKGKDDNKTMGKYVEKQIDLPITEGERVVSLVEGDDGKPVLFTADEAGTAYKAYQYEDGKFTEGDASWLNVAAQAGGSLDRVVRGQDGSLYALYSDAEGMFHILKNMDGGQEVTIPALAEKGDMDIYPFVYDMRADKDGNIYLAYSITSEAVMYDQNTGAKIRSFASGRSADQLGLLMDVKDHNILLVNPESDGFTCYDTGSGEVVSETESVDIQGYNGILMFGDDDDFVYSDSKGLHHLTLGGNIAEDLIEENGTAFGVPQNTPSGLLKTGEKEYLMVFQGNPSTDGSTYQMYSYKYDKSAKTKPDNILSIYGLTESDAVRQAIAKFQQEHPDITIDYKTGNTGEGTQTKADSIRALNTELLGGNGADVIMLDGLPADSYIEKGVLEDLGNVLKDVKKENKLNDNIISPYEKGGKLYQIPTRYGIPIVAGDSEKIEALKSADALKAFVGDSESTDIIGKVSKEDFMKLLININYKDIVKEDYQMDQEVLADLIETAGKTQEPEDNETETVIGGDEEMERSGWDAGGFTDFVNGNGLYTGEIKGVMGMMIPYNFMRKTGIEPADVNGIYVPHDIAAINKASEQKETAEEFIKLLLSTEVQSIDLEGGFPVNNDALDALVQSVSETPDESGTSISMGKSSAGGEEGDNSFETINLPLRSEVQALTEMGSRLKTPVQKDDVIGEMILDGAKTYFDGSRTAKEAAADIAEKADTYLAE